MGKYNDALRVLGGYANDYVYSGKVPDYTMLEVDEAYAELMQLIADMEYVDNVIAPKLKEVEEENDILRIALRKASNLLKEYSQQKDDEQWFKHLYDQATKMNKYRGL